MYKVKIYGAGSIGNHMARAATGFGLDVLICDVDAEALRRTRDQIYPQRYGAWDDRIRLSLVEDAPKEAFDIVIIGTPPDTHLRLAAQALHVERPRALLIEKPLCTPDLSGAQEFYEQVLDSNTKVFVGYNHTLGKNSVEAERILRSGKVGECITINAAFQEHWGGIFDAHSWLAGPQDSYLGFFERGGGASGEHSHAINIWQHFAHTLDLGRVVEVLAAMDLVESSKYAYDQICHLAVRTEKGAYGTIVQDVVTRPSKKYLRVQGKDGFLEWFVNLEADQDAVVSQAYGETLNRKLLPKKRPDDFKREIEHVLQILNGEVHDSPIALERGLDTMMVLAAAHLSHAQKRAMQIDYSSGYALESIHAV